MSFMLVRNAWYCQFLEDDLRTSLPRKLSFASPEKITELVRRCGGLSNLECAQALQLGIVAGRGGVFLKLNAEQYRALKRAG